MAKQVINIGTVANDRSGDPLRTAFDKVNQNFTELYNIVETASLTELAQDYAAAMLTGGTHSGVTVTYDDANNKLNLSVSAGSTVSSLNDLTDVDYSGPGIQTGQVLKWSALTGAFQNGNVTWSEISMAPTIPSDISQLTDTQNLLGGTGNTIETVSAGGTSGAETVLDLTKRTHVLKDGWYSLAAGTEGQVMYFVPHSTVSDITTINIRVNNGRYSNGTTVTDFANNFITVFSGQIGTVMATAIYADGAWHFNTGAWD